MNTTENEQKKSPRIFDGAVRIIVLQIAAVTAFFAIALGLKLADAKLYKQISEKFLSEINTRTDISQVTGNKTEKSDKKESEISKVTEIEPQEQTDKNNADDGQPENASESDNENNETNSGTEQTSADNSTDGTSGGAVKSVSASYICDLKSDAHNSLIWPVSGTVTSEFGSRSDPINGTASSHGGIDIAVNTGTPIAAVLSGVVEKAETDPFYGNYILIKHSENFKTLYGHCSNLAATTGQEVHGGDIIAYSGSTGRSTGPHLHFEIRIGGKKTDPRLLLPAQKTV